MQWREEGMLVSVRRHGESSAIVELFTAGHGLHAGIVRGGAGRRLAPVLQPGTQLDATWRARLEDHLGTFTVEPVKSRSAIIGDRRALAALNAICGLLSFALPEREPHPRLHAQTMTLLNLIEARGPWPVAYLAWERALLEDLGFGLDLGRCAVTGQGEDLAFVSPRTGRAVSHGAAGDWADRLLPLPPELIGEGESEAGVLAGLRTTGHFLERWLAPSLGDRPLPRARGRLIELLQR